MIQIFKTLQTILFLLTLSSCISSRVEFYALDEEGIDRYNLSDSYYDSTIIRLSEKNAATLDTNDYKIEFYSKDFLFKNESFIFIFPLPLSSDLEYSREDKIRWFRIKNLSKKDIVINKLLMEGNNTDFYVRGNEYTKYQHKYQSNDNIGLTLAQYQYIFIGLSQIDEFKLVFGGELNKTISVKKNVGYDIKTITR